LKLGFAHGTGIKPRDAARRPNWKKEAFDMLIRNRKKLLFVMIAAALLITAIQVSSAVAQGAKIKVGRTVGGSGFHIPSYVAMDKGFFKGEGLDATVNLFSFFHIKQGGARKS